MSTRKEPLNNAKEQAKDKTNFQNVGMQKIQLALFTEPLSNPTTIMY